MGEGRPGEGATGERTGPEPRLLGIAGMVGTGKTTLTGRLAARFGLHPALESVDADNPWLPLYYGRPDGARRYGLELQLHFLATRMRDLRRMRERGGAWVIDRTVYEDAEVFARGLHEGGLLSDDRWALYRALYAELLHLPAARPPRLLVYLHGPLDTVVARIRSRGRPEEREVPRAYWAALHERYERWITGFGLCPVLRLDVRDYDVVEDPGAVDAIARRVREEAGVDLARLAAEG